MSDNGFITDLLAAQQELPALQKSAINPHFKNRYIPLEELIAAVVPVLNKHNFVLLQMPTVLPDGQPGLTSELLHTSGERLGTTMPLLCAKDDPQGQGSAITYARRYSLMGMLGMSADPDDDAQSTVRNGHAPIQGGVNREVPAAQPKHRAPRCPLHHQEMNLVKAGVSKKTGKPYAAFYSCPERECKRSINLADWEMQQDQLVQDSGAMEEPDAVPFE